MIISQATKFANLRKLAFRILITTGVEPKDSPESKDESTFAYTLLSAAVGGYIVPLPVIVNELEAELSLPRASKAVDDENSAFWPSRGALRGEKTLLKFFCDGIPAGIE